MFGSGTKISSNSVRFKLALGFLLPLLALAAALVQAYWLPEPQRDVVAYLSIWVPTAMLSLLIISVETITRARRLHCGLAAQTQAVLRSDNFTRNAKSMLRAPGCRGGSAGQANLS